MIEAIMFFAGGFLIASLIGLAMAPLVHARAVRLTERDIAANSPFSMTEIKADRDQLRADFAVSTRRLEQQFERFRARAAAQISILGRKADGINRLKAELAAQNAAVLALEAQAKGLREEMADAQQRHAGEIARMTQEYAETRTSMETGHAAAMKTTVDDYELRLRAANEFHEGEKSSLLATHAASLEAFDRQIAETAQRLSTTEQALEAARADAATLRENLATMTDTAAGRLAELQAREKELAEARGELAAVIARRDKLDADLATANTALEHSRRENVALTRELIETRNVVSGHSSSIARLESDAAALNADIDSRRAHIAALEADLAARGERLTAAEAHIGVLEGDLDKSRRVETAMRGAVDALELQVAAAARSVAENADELAKARKAAATAEVAAAAAQLQIADFGGKETSLSESLKHDKKLLGEQLRRVQEERLSLQRELTAARLAASAGDPRELETLRDRMAGIAADVTRLAMAMEGPASPIHAILANGDGPDAPGSLAARIKQMPPPVMRAAANAETRALP